ncbi:MAG: DUF1330 domain-containing protein [Candidatus Latescibacteria bacterium]|nr:DUF1330 domain-containing protein [Candidatus Latescibacterota bacterium]
MLLLARLFIHPGQEEAFRQFETVAARIMARHGGRIERVIRPLSALPESPLPHEIHLVSFPSQEHFAAYRADAELAALAPLRQQAIARTELVIGVEGEPWG